MPTKIQISRRTRRAFVHHPDVTVTAVKVRKETDQSLHYRFAIRLGGGQMHHILVSQMEPLGTIARIGLPPEKWSSLRYGFKPCGGCCHGTEEAYC